MLAEPQLLVALVLAHLLADFYFQPFTWVQQRNERHALALPFAPPTPCMEKDLAMLDYINVFILKIHLLNCCRKCFS